MLSGVHGDGLWHATGVRRDMVRHGRWLEVLRDVLRAAHLGGTARRLVDAGLGVLPPVTAMVVAERILGERPASQEWMGPALRELRPPRLSRRDLAGQEWTSHLMCAAWSRITGPGAALTLEGFVEFAAQAGIELRAPYADVRLAEQVWQIPWQDREPRGHYRRTGRDALGPLLPSEFAARRGQNPWTDVWAANARRSAWGIAPLIQDGPWISAPFVDRGIARALLARVLKTETPPPELCRLVLQFGGLEAWLRELLQ